MKPHEFSKISQWKCTESGKNSVRVVAPFTYSNDGQHIAFYLATDDEKYFLTDAGETAVHISSLGGDISYKKMLGVLGRSGTDYVKISQSGEIQSFGDISSVQIALWDAALLAYKMSADSQSWMPKLNQIQFKQLVENTIRKSVGEKRIIHNAKTHGISGHELEFPFAVISASNDKLFFVEPISANENGTLDWGVVHKTLGKMTDQKEANSDNERLIIVSEDVDQNEYGNASTILSRVASIRQLNTTSDWAIAFAA